MKLNAGYRFASLFGPTGRVNNAARFNDGFYHMIIDPFVANDLLTDESLPTWPSTTAAPPSRVASTC